MNEKKSVLQSRQYRDEPSEFIEPSPDALKARNKRSYAIAISLALFMLFVFVTMVSRGSA